MTQVGLGLVTTMTEPQTWATGPSLLLFYCALGTCHTFGCWFIFYVLY